jgi:antitoxin component of MazEF toxin-antitoxin module
MTEFESKLKKWGNSFGIVVPKRILNEEGLNENFKVQVMIKTEKSPIKKAFGSLKGWKIDPQKFKDEARKQEKEAEKRKFKK